MTTNSQIATLTSVLGECTGIVFSARTIHETAALLEIAFWFEELSFREGPVISLKAEGLHRHSVQVKFGIDSEPIVRQIQSATSEQKYVVNKLLYLSEQRGFKVNSKLITLEKLQVGDVLFDASASRINAHLAFDSLRKTIENVVSVIALATAELIGYVEKPAEMTIYDEYELEGSITLRLVHQRERSRKNRQLCIGFHGESCAACGLNPKDKYGLIGQIIEVHHIQPLSTLEKERPFNPVTDLVPLCPNCHRAIHTRKPIPLTLDELKAMIVNNNG